VSPFFNERCRLSAQRVAQKDRDMALEPESLRHDLAVKIRGAAFDDPAVLIREVERHRQAHSSESVHPPRATRRWVVDCGQSQQHDRSPCRAHRQPRESADCSDNGQHTRNLLAPAWMRYSARAT
jgi:hypothetical protein